MSDGRVRVMEGELVEDIGVPRPEFRAGYIMIRLRDAGDFCPGFIKQ